MGLLWGLNEIMNKAPGQPRPTANSVMRIGSNHGCYYYVLSATALCHMLDSGFFYFGYAVLILILFILSVLISKSPYLLTS